MNIKIIREVTDWDLPGHTYAFDGGKIVAYRARGSQDIWVFSKSLRFERSQRQFETVRDTETIQAFRRALNQGE